MLFTSFRFHVWISPTHRILHTIFCFTCSRICSGNLPREFAAEICRRNLPQKLAVAICRENLPQEFAVGICCKNLQWLIPASNCKQIFFFCICEQILFIWKQTFFICEQNLFMRFSLLTVLLFVIMNHKVKFWLTILEHSVWKETLQFSQKYFVVLWQPPHLCWLPLPVQWLLLSYRTLGLL